MAHVSLVTRAIVLIACSIIALLPALSYADELADDYKVMVSRRHTVEAEQKTYEDQLNALTSQLDTSELGFSKCASQKWRVFWEPRRKDAERAREQLEEQRHKLFGLRNELNSLRRDLDISRREIERKYSDKSIGSEYETAFRQYMAKLDGYLDDVQTELFYGYKEYAVGVQEYIYFVNSSASMCHDGDISEGAAELAADHINQILDAVSKIAGAIKKA